MSAQQVIGPTSHYFYSQRLKLHYVDWGNPDKPLLVLVHGGRDHARNWDWVAQALRSDYHIIVPDLRGHGDSEWARGSEYTMVEYVVDIAQLLSQLDTFPVRLIGHSLGGGIVLQYTGVYPEKVSKVVSIEGLGPPPEMIEQQSKHAHERMQRWIAEMRNLAGRLPRRYKTLDEAVQRMREANQRLSEEQAYHLTVHGLCRNEDGTYTWKFDNYVRAQSPYRFNLDDAWEIWGRITCPTLLFRGMESWASDPEKDGRIKAFQNARLVNVPRAGHWVHHDQLAIFLNEVRGFLRS
ncbi:MAG: alpha/beta hydrolase [Deltaproteobacteria bacterium]|nr:alpha/beta hydrolase [Deltaproteobacteria bacterium]